MDLSVQTDHDLALDPATGDVAVVTGGEAIMQDIHVRLMTHRGEWFLDTDAGIPYLTEISTKITGGPILHRVASVIKDCIIGTPGVLQLLSFELSLDAPTRKLSVAFEAQTESGEISYTGDLP